MSFGHLAKRCLICMIIKHYRFPFRTPWNSRLSNWLGLRVYSYARVQVKQTNPLMSPSKFILLVAVLDSGEKRVISNLRKSSWSHFSCAYLPVYYLQVWAIYIIYFVTEPLSLFKKHEHNANHTANVINLSSLFLDLLTYFQDNDHPTECSPSSAPWVKEISKVN